jgi:hypothetical protein
MTVIHENILKRMSPADRKAMGKTGWTAQECIERAVIKSERDLQNQIVSYLKCCRGVNWVIWSRMDRPTTLATGTPDICFVTEAIDYSLGSSGFRYRAAIAFEVKLPGKDLDPAQIEARDAMMEDGWRHAVIRSLSEAKDFLDNL